MQRGSAPAAPGLPPPSDHKTSGRAGVLEGCWQQFCSLGKQEHLLLWYLWLSIYCWFMLMQFCHACWLLQCLSHCQRPPFEEVASSRIHFSPAAQSLSTAVRPARPAPAPGNHTPNKVMCIRTSEDLQISIQSGKETPHVKKVKNTAKLQTYNANVRQAISSTVCHHSCWAPLMHRTCKLLLIPGSWWTEIWKSLKLLEMWEKCWVERSCLRCVLSEFYHRDYPLILVIAVSQNDSRISVSESFWEFLGDVIRKALRFEATALVLRICQQGRSCDFGEGVDHGSCWENEEERTATWHYDVLLLT